MSRGTSSIGSPAGHPTNDHAFYATHSPITEPGAARQFLDGLPDDIAELARVIGGVMVHRDATAAFGFILPDDRRQEAELRYVSVMLDRLGSLAPRSPAQRLAVTCRDFVVLLCAILRHQGRPARARAGFASYFTPRGLDDHWVAEVWADDTWRLVDAQLASAPPGTYSTSDLDPLDVPRDAFLVGGQAWLDC